MHFGEKVITGYRNIIEINLMYAFRQSEVAVPKEEEEQNNNNIIILQHNQMSVSQYYTFTNMSYY
jgi:hypothetical protein